MTSSTGRPAGTSLAFVAAAILLACAIAAAEPPAFTIGPETTVVEGPIRADGSIDYVAALNQRLSEGLTPQNNAFVDLAATMGPDAWPPVPGYRQQVYEMLGLPVPEQVAAMIGFRQYLEAQGLIKTFEHPENPFFSMPPGNTELESNYEMAQTRPWTAEEFPHVANYLKAMTPALDRIAAASTKLRYYAPLIADNDNPALFDVLLPALGQSRDVTRALAARAQGHIASNDLDAAWRDAMIIGRLAHLISQEPIYVSNLVARSLVSMRTPIITSIAGCPHLTPRQAHRMVEELQNLQPIPPLAHAVEVGERWMVLDGVMSLVHRGNLSDWVRVPFGTLEEYEAMDERRKSVVAIARSPAFDIDASLRHVNSIMDELVVISQMQDYARQQSQIHRLEEARDQRLLDAGPRLNQRVDPAEFGEFIGDLYLGGSFASLSRSIDTEARTDTIGDLQRIALALGGYHAEHGRFPDTLADLTPQHLPALPTDRFTKGQPLHYRVEADTAVIYSVGSDQDDDGGADREENPGGSGDVALRLTRASGR